MFTCCVCDNSSKCLLLSKSKAFKDLFDMANTFRTVTNTVAHGKLTYDSKNVYTIIKGKSVVHTVNVKIHFMKYIFYP